MVSVFIVPGHNSNQTVLRHATSLREFDLRAEKRHGAGQAGAGGYCRVIFGLRALLIITRTRLSSYIPQISLWPAEPSEGAL